MVKSANAKGDMPNTIKAEAICFNFIKLSKQTVDVIKESQCHHEQHGSQSEA